MVRPVTTSGLALPVTGSPELGVAVKAVMAAPLSAAAAKAIDTLVPSGVVLTMVGCSGTPTVTAACGAEKGLWPARLLADTLIGYATPLDRPGRLIGLAGPVADIASSLVATVK